MPCAVVPFALAASSEHSSSKAASSCAFLSAGLAKARMAFTTLNLLTSCLVIPISDGVSNG